MEYSLYHLNQASDLENLTLPMLTDKLNLIGFEVDDIFLEPLSTNLNLENIRLLIKIPSNREDLLNETFLKKELSIIFLFQLNHIWNKLQKNYFFLLKQKYIQSYPYKNYPIDSSLPHILMYNIELNQFQIPLTPSWIKMKLKNAGLPVTSTIPNILNLISLEWGQTFNLFQQKGGSNFSLDQLVQPERYQDFFLEKGTIVLKDQFGKILTVLGHFSTLPAPTQGQNLVLQACFYDIHQNLLKLNTINTKLSFRFLRKTYLETFKIAFQRLLTLLELLSIETLQIKKYSNAQTTLKLKPPKILKLKKQGLIKLLNLCEIDLDIFRKANLKLLCKTQKELYFSIPNFRIDLTREIDLIEEYSRFVGYRNLKELFPIKTPTYFPKEKKSTEWMKHFFLTHGFHEIITTSLQEKTKTKGISIHLNNPLNNEMSILRSSLLEKIIEIFETNFKIQNSTQNSFEIGRVFKNSQGKIIEQDQISGVFEVDATTLPSLTWFKAKGFIEMFFTHFGYTELEIRPFNHPDSFYHPTRSILFQSGKKILGKFGQINPLKSNFKQALFIFELNLCYLHQWQMSSPILNYEEYSKYPAIVKDLSFVIRKDISFNQIKESIRQKTFYLKNLSFFDIYCEEKERVLVNIGLRCEFQSKTQTLVNEIIETEIIKIKQILVEQFAVQFRE
jgi:phenylalanyl-tRNA synthetase beta chain